MPLFRLHIPLLDDIKAKGLKTALRDTTDETFTRITAGLNIGDFRSMLRDDPPGRPNPRLKPHSESFWLHIRPTYYHNLVNGIYPTFKLGWLSTFFFVFESITGVFLMFWYTPSPLVAYENMLDILSNVPFGRLMRDLHKLGAELMVAIVVLHMLRTFITGSYKKPRQFTWATGIILLGVTLILSFSGYLLPWDQLSLWAVTIGASMAEAVPPEVVGRNLNLLVRGAPEFGANGLLRFYLLHVVGLPLIGAIAFGVHYYKVIIHGHSLPPEAEEVGEDTAKRVPMPTRSYFLPTIATRELFYVSALIAALVAAVVFVYHAPLEPHADPLITPLHTTAPWYFLWLQGLLKLGDKVIWGVIVPFGILAPLLLVFPYLEVGPSRRYGDRRIGLSIGALSVLAVSILTFMGTPWYGVDTSPEQEAIATLLPQTHPGPVRLANWEELEFGTFEASAYEIAPTPILQELLHTFDEELDHVRGPDRTGVEGLMVIEDWQTDLKKITFRIIWTMIENDAPGEFSQTTYLHRTSDYGQGE
jgi:quinol-cytochrome oxidoreductase complex cytochrome b subunit